MALSRKGNWMTRPRWWLLLGMPAALLAWLLWPTKVYEPGVRNFLIVARETNAEILGVVRIEWEETPWEAEKAFADWVEKTGTDLAPEVGKRGHRWFYEGDQPDRLAFCRHNAIVTVEPTDEFLGRKRGESDWMARIESVAAQKDREFDSGSLGGRELVTRWKPRFLLRYPEEMESAEKKWKELRDKWFP